MKRSKTRLLALALAGFLLTAWAGDNAALDGSKSDRDNKTVVVPGQPATEIEKPGQATQSPPSEDRAPAPEDKSSQPAGRRSSAAQPPRARRDAVQASESRPQANQTLGRDEERGRSYAEPVRAQTRESDGSSGAAAGVNVLRSGGEPNRRRAGGGGGGGRGGHGRGRWHDHGPGWHWRNHHYERHNCHFHNSWHFVWYWGPVICPEPVYVPHVVRCHRSRFGVYVRQTGTDEVGEDFARSVRHALSDRGLCVVYSQQDARLELYLVSMALDPDEPGRGSAVSISYIRYPGDNFIVSQLLEVGSGDMDELAESVAGYADDMVDRYR
jgi:hypothetical protein